MASRICREVGRILTLWAVCCAGVEAADHVPTDGMLLWLQADCPGELDEAGGVKLWENHAPEISEDALQCEAVRRPRRIGSVSSLGGQPAVQFDGKDDFLHLPWLVLGRRRRRSSLPKTREQTTGGSYWRTILSGDDDSFRDGATKYALGFRRSGFDPVFIANLYYAQHKPHRLMQPATPPTSIGFHIYSFRRSGSSSEGMTLRVDGQPWRA